MATSGFLAAAVLLIAFPTFCLTQPGQLLEYAIPEGDRDVTYIASILYDVGLGKDYSLALLQTFRFTVLTAKPLSAAYFTFKNLGELHQDRDIDRESICPGQTECYIDLDIGIKPVQFFQLIKVRVSILDINDNAPEFLQEEVVIQISELANPGAVFAIPAAVDRDSGVNRIQKYSLVTKTNKFALKTTAGEPEMMTQSETVEIVLKRKLDHEETKSYSLKLVALDNGSPQLSGSVVINIEVVDANDNNPVFQNSTLAVNISENIEKDTSIAKLRATDLDDGPNGEISYKFSQATEEQYGSKFKVDEKLGEIIVIGTIDFEDRSDYYLTVVAQDAGVSALSAYAKVIVHVQDVNDHTPELTVNAMTTDGRIRVKENSPLGTFVAHISVVDPDEGRNGWVRCVLDSGYFELVKLYSTELKLVTRAVFDRELVSEYNLSIACKDDGAAPKVSVTHLNVKISDENDNDPAFDDDFYTFSIEENNDIGAFIAQINATDLDNDKNAEIRYFFEMSESKSFLHIDSLTGVITANMNFDRERTSSYEFVVVAQDQGHPQRSSTTTLSLTVEDVNDEAAKFGETEFVFGTFENQAIGTEIGVVQANDADLPPNNNIVYFLDPESADAESFQVDPNSGRITTAQVLDREQQDKLHIVILARDPDSDLEGSTNVTIFVADRNDHAPVLSFPNEVNNTVEILGLPRTGDVITQIEAEDLDIGMNSALTFTLMDGNTDDVFVINPQLGTVVLVKNLRDYSGMVFELIILVEDGGDEKLSTIETLYVFVNNSAAVAAAAAAIASHIDYSGTLLVLSLTLMPLVIIALALVLIYTWRRHSERVTQRRKYNSRVQATRALMAIALERKTNGNGKDLIYRNYDTQKTNYDVKNLNKKLNYDVNDNCGEEGSLWMDAASPLPLLQSPQAHSTMVNMGSAVSIPTQPIYRTADQAYGNQWTNYYPNKPMNTCEVVERQPFYPCHLEWNDLQDSRSLQRSSSLKEEDQGHLKVMPHKGRPASYREEWQRLRGQWRSGRADWSKFDLSEVNEQTSTKDETDHVSQPDGLCGVHNRGSLSDSGHGHSEESDQLIATPEQTDDRQHDCHTPSKPPIPDTSSDGTTDTTQSPISSTDSSLGSSGDAHAPFLRYCASGVRRNQGNSARRSLPFSERASVHGYKQPMRREDGYYGNWGYQCPNDSLYPESVRQEEGFPTYYDLLYSPKRRGGRGSRRQDCECVSPGAVTQCIHSTVGRYMPSSTPVTPYSDVTDMSTTSSDSKGVTTSDDESSESGTWMCYSDVIV